MKDNYLLSGLWIAATVGGLLYGAVHATRAARAEAVAMETARMREEMKHAVQVGQADRFADAARLLEALQARYPQDTAVTLNLGLTYKALRQLDDADAQFQRVLALDPEDWDAVAERASVFKLKGDEAKAFELMASVPAGKGRMRERLMGDPDWAEAEDMDRLEKLRQTHGMGQRGDTAVRRLMEMEKRRREFEAANKPATPAPEDGAPQH